MGNTLMRCWPLVLIFLVAVGYKTTGAINERQTQSITEAFRGDQPPQKDFVGPESIDVYVYERALVTAYCPCIRCCGRFSDGKTSTGVDALLSGVAADPKRLPYGTVLIIPGYGRTSVDDTGSAMRNADDLHIDVRFPTHQEALEFGRQRLGIEILKVDLQK